MQELISKKSANGITRWGLLAGTSTIALMIHVSSVTVAQADDMERPQVWIELGGQAERMGNSPELFTPPFLANTPDADLTPMIKAEKPSPYSLGLEGKISFSPEHSDWVFSASAIYGRARASRHNHQQTPLPYVKQFAAGSILPQPAAEQFGDGQSDLRETHLVLDFQAGKDVGIGLFGSHGSSIISAGVRFAQFTESASITLNARPYNKVGAVHTKYVSFYQSTPVPHYVPIGFRNVDLFRHTYAATAQMHRNSHAIGPSVSWNASMPVVGNEKDMTLNFDWGVNAAVLFGRQRTTVHHKTSGHHYSRTGLIFVSEQTHAGGYTRPPIARSNSRGVTIPNVGGFAGMSLKFPNAHVSIGYRADVFFGAIDGGIDTVKSQNRSFYGPFATIGIGFGG